MHRPTFAMLIILLALTSCASDQPPQNDTHMPQGFTNSSDDDNGVAPPPNNGSQNFGHKR